MNKQEQIITMCREALLNSTQRHMDALTNIFANPCEYQTVLKVITDPYVAFMFCLIVRKHLKNMDEWFLLPQASDPCEYKGPDYNSEEAIQVATSTEFCQYLLSFLNSTQQNDFTEKGHPYDGTISKIKKKNQPIRPQFLSKIWSQSLIYTNLLIYSKSRQEDMSSLEQLDLYNGLDRLRFELLARLSINIQISYEKSPNKIENYEDMLKKMVNFDEQSELKSIQDMVNLIYEIIIHIQQAQQLIKVKVFTKSFGNSLMDILMNYLRKLLHSYSFSKQLINKCLSAINQYISLVTVQRNRRIYVGRVKVCEEQENDFYQRKVYRTDGLINFHFEFTKSAIDIVNLPDSEGMGQPLQRSLEILDKITLLSFTEQNEEALCTRYFLQFQENLSTFMSNCILKWMNISNNDQQKLEINDLYYTESLIINVLGNIFSNYLPFFFTHKQLLALSINYCSQIIKKVPIKVSQAQKSVIACAFDYLFDIFRVNRKLDDTSQLIFAMKGITQQFFATCFAQEYNEEFVNFEEEAEACAMFFDPVIELMQNLYIQQKKLSPCNPFVMMQNYIAKLKYSDTQKITILEILMIEMVKDIQTFENKDCCEQKCKLLFNLLELMSRKKDIRYLMLLDVISYQIIDDDQSEIGCQSSYIWYYIDRHTSYTPASMMTLVSTELVQYLVKGSSLYLAKYAIHLLIRICNQLKKVEYNQKNNKQKCQKIINKYMSPVVGFVNNLDLTVLDHSDSYEQRGNLLELICYVGVIRVEDAYKIYSAVRSNLFKTKNNDRLRFIIDVTGLLSNNCDEQMEEVILELVFNDLKENYNIFNIFTVDSLSDEAYFKAYTAFLLKVAKKVKRLKCHDCLIADFELIFHQKYDLLTFVYDETNFEAIHEAWLAFSQLDRMRLRFPKIPPIIYHGTSATQLVDWIYRNLSKLQDWEQVKILYRNTFERRSQQYQDCIDDKLKEDIIQLSSVPEYLFLLSDFIEISGECIFFDYLTLIDSHLITLYKQYKEGNSSAMTLDSFELDFGSDFQRESANFLAEFYNRQEYKKKVHYLVTALYIFDFVTYKIDKKFANFREEFMENIKNTIQNYSFA